MFVVLGSVWRRAAGFSLLQVTPVHTNDGKDNGHRGGKCVRWHAKPAFVGNIIIQNWRSGLGTKKLQVFHKVCKFLPICIAYSKQRTLPTRFPAQPFWPHKSGEVRSDLNDKPKEKGVTGLWFAEWDKGHGFTLWANPCLIFTQDVNGLFAVWYEWVVLCCSFCGNVIRPRFEEVTSSSLMLLGYFCSHRWGCLC